MSLMRITGELLGLGCTPVEARNRRDQLVWRYLYDAAALQNTGRLAPDVTDRPGDDIVEGLADDLKPVALDVALALCGIVRALGGSDPDLGLPMAYAAEAVQSVAAALTAPTSTGGGGFR